MTYTFCVVEEGGRPLLTCCSSDVPAPSFPTIGLLYSVATFTESTGLVLDAFASDGVQVVYKRCAPVVCGQRQSALLAPSRPDLLYSFPYLLASDTNAGSNKRNRCGSIMLILATGTSRGSQGQLQELLASLHALLVLLVGRRALADETAVGIMHLKRKVKAAAPWLEAVLAGSFAPPGGAAAGTAAGTPAPFAPPPPLPLLDALLPMCHMLPLEPPQRAAIAAALDALCQQDSPGTTLCAALMKGKRSSLRPALSDAPLPVCCARPLSWLPSSNNTLAAPVIPNTHTLCICILV